ncbi:MAG: hypothetical protein GON13_01465 [Nanoarchaeota archaeon]|nr:hypothetical protein [Nanoarchaeota archaeon]
MKILLDTNFCLLIIKKGWILEQLKGNELIITDFIKKEVKKVSSKNEIILKTLEEQEVKTLKTTHEKGDNDNALIRTAQKIKAAIATNDSELRQKAKKKGVQTYCLKQEQIIRKG